jgi:protein-tyrosine phosphatase
MRTLVLVLGLAVLGAPACVADSTDVASSESDLTQSLTLRFVDTDGTLSMRASGRRLECVERFEGLAGERITCERDGETVQAIVKYDGQSVIAVQDLNRERGYYACTPTGDVQGLPAKMACQRTTIQPRGTGGLSSPFDPTVDGLDVPNTHWVDDSEMVLRGMEPRTAEQYDELRALGVERVLIFKNNTATTDVGEEIAEWDMPEGDVLQVPFRWKDLEGFQTTCAQTLEALRFIHASEEAGQKTFLHCTVGEDRTGYLAALYGMIFEGVAARDAFEDDMCERGYSSGNPQKPWFVVSALRKEVTPLYRAMAYLVEQGTLDGDLDDAACASEPVVPDDYLSDSLTCGVSTTLVP